MLPHTMVQLVWELDCLESNETNFCATPIRDFLVRLFEAGRFPLNLGDSLNKRTEKKKAIIFPACHHSHWQVHIYFCWIFSSKVLQLTSSKFQCWVRVSLRPSVTDHNFGDAQTWGPKPYWIFLPIWCETNSVELPDGYLINQSIKSHICRDVIWGIERMNTEEIK